MPKLDLTCCGPLSWRNLVNWDIDIFLPVSSNIVSSPVGSQRLKCCHRDGFRLLIGTSLPVSCSSINNSTRLKFYESLSLPNPHATVSSSPAVIGLFSYL